MRIDDISLFVLRILQSLCATERLKPRDVWDFELMNKWFWAASEIITWEIYETKGFPLETIEEVRFIAGAEFLTGLRSLIE